MLKLYQSNRLEQLADQLADLLPLCHRSIFTPDSIVVPHLGMRRWLTLHLAERLDICANVEFPLPARLIWDLFRNAEVDVPEQSLFTPDILSWRILALLPQFKDDPRFAPITSYLQHTSELEQYQLACRIAEVFDQYLVYRPDWLTAWEAGKSKIKGDDWQAELWRQLATDDAGPHWIHLLQHFEKLLDEKKLSDLPDQLTLFGISSLSPTFLQLINRLAEQIDIHLFLLNPCQSYWTDIVSPPEEARQQANSNHLDLYLEVGNPMLASLGRQGRDFFAAIFELDPGSETHFIEPSGESQLATLQRDILNLEISSCQAADNSIRIHACHSPMREIEVLRDQLLDIFQQNPQLTPEDVLVMSPDIDRYAPAIEALFSAPDQPPYLPYTIIGLQPLETEPALRIFFSLLQTAQGRMSASEVVALLEYAPLRRRFSITDEALPHITQWIEQSAIRWGRNAKSLGQLGLPERGENSWQRGLQRLLLGYAMSGEMPPLISNILPAGDIEGSEAAILGGLCEFLQRLFQLSDQLKQSHTINHWCYTLRQQLDLFFKPDEQEDELATIRTALEQAEQQTTAAKFEQPVGIELFTAHLKRVIESSASGRQSGRGIIFGSPATLRTLPAEVICFIGMNDGRFPREQHPLGFDLMAKLPRIGDRSRRADDRYLFLECLLAARHTLYISYTGLGVRDNKPLPPSELVNELLDYLGRDELLVEHPLQPFNHRYFSADSSLFSYSKQMCEAGEIQSKAGEESSPFFTQPLPTPEEEWQQISLKQLHSFFSSPARFLLQQRLGIRLDEGDGLLESSEPFELEFLQGIALKERMLMSDDRQQCYKIEAASGHLPQGEPGRALFNREWSDADHFKQRVDALALPENCEPQSIEINLQFDNLRLNGQLNGVMPAGFVTTVPHPLWANQHLTFWLNHLILNTIKPAGIDLTSRCLDSEKLYQLPPIEEAADLLQQLLQHYWQGLTTPLPLLPKTSLAYAECIAADKSEEQALAKAREKWLGGFFAEGECEKPYFKLTFRGLEPLNNEFQSLSEQLFLPYLQHRESL
jgi:exodeoxyribonuclease V gamma subunit